MNIFIQLINLIETARTKKQYSDILIYGMELIIYFPSCSSRIKPQQKEIAIKTLKQVFLYLSLLKQKGMMAQFIRIAHKSRIKYFDELSLSYLDYADQLISYIKSNETCTKEILYEKLKINNMIIDELITAGSELNIFERDKQKIYFLGFNNKEISEFLNNNK